MASVKKPIVPQMRLTARDPCLSHAVVRSGIALADIISKDLNQNVSLFTPPVELRNFTPLIDLKPASPTDSTGGYGLGSQDTTSAEKLISCVLEGDVDKTRQLLRTCPDLSVNFRKDGYTALEMAVLQQEVEIFREILQHPRVEVDQALVIAVSVGCCRMVQQILLKVRDDECPCEGVPEENVLRSDTFREMVSLALTEATRQDKWAVVETLLQDPYRLPDLQSLHYGETEEGMRRVELVLRRLREYRVVCSPVYLALDKADPILTAFIYSRNLRYWAHCFSAFKWQFEALADQVDQFAVDLLSQCRTTAEVELVLQAPKDERGQINRRHTWARLSLAVSFQQQKFVSNPLCQHVVQNTWIGGLDLMSVCHLRNLSHHWWSLAKFILLFAAFVVLYPALPLVAGCWLGETTLYKKSQVPCVKLMSELIGYLWFLGLVLADTFLGQEHQHAAYLDYVIGLWIVSVLFHKLSLYVRVRKYFFVFWVNLYDILMAVLYLVIFALEHSKEFSSCILGPENEHDPLYINPDGQADETCDSESELSLESCRVHRPWTHYMLVAEACSAVFNMMACLRLLYLFQITSFLGPMQVSLVKMIKDIVKFFIMFTIVLLSFAVGLYKLYSSYKGGTVVEDGAKVVQDETFASFQGSVQALFWSLFGLVDLSVANMVVGQYNVTLADNSSRLITVDHYINEALGHFLWGLYHLVAGLVLLNILIATMNESFVRVQNNADAEWKFARTQVYLLYMEPGRRFPPPFNLLLCLPWLGRVVIQTGQRIVDWLLTKPTQQEINENPSDESKLRYESQDSKYLELIKVLVGRYRKLHEQKVKTAEAVETVISPLMSARASGSRRKVWRRRPMVGRPCGLSDRLQHRDSLAQDDAFLPLSP